MQGSNSHGRTRTLVRTALHGATAAALFSSALFSSACVSSPDDLDAVASTAPLYVQTSKVWPSGNIPVCWENPSQSNATERGWVQNQIGKTWEQVGSINFTGWGTCTNASRGVRVQIIDQVGAPNSLIGTDLDGSPNGMELNFTFTKWDGVNDPAKAADGSCAATAAQREACIRAIATHEFGHALGFLHEQRRKDAPAWCVTDQKNAGNSAGDGISGGVNEGAWDVDSVMNYCNPNWNNGGVLSATDTAGARKYYPPPPPAAPSQPSLTKEYLGCQGSAARYEISWSPGTTGPAPTSFDVDYRRGSGSWASLSNGTARSAMFSTSDGHTSVTIRARACKGSSCSAFRSTTFTPFECGGGGGGGGGGGNPL